MSVPIPDGPALVAFLHARLAGVLRLPLSAIAVDTPLSALGVDSLAAAELQAELEEALGREVSYDDLLGGADIRGLAERLADAPPVGEGAPPPAPPERTGYEDDACREAPLSPGQRALWYLHRLAPESPVYNLAAAARLPADTDTAALGRAVERLVDRHDALRATFHPPAPGADGPWQRMASRGAVALSVVDARSWGGEALRQRLAEEAFRPFDLERGPVLRAALFTHPEGTYLVLAVHHLAADLASFGVLVRELGALYDACRQGDRQEPLPTPALGYADYARWQESTLLGPWGDRLWSYWRERLAGAPALELPADRPRPSSPTFEGEALRFRLGVDRARRLRELARGRGLTPFMVLLAGFEALLARVSGQEDFVVGSPSSGRSPERFGGRLADLVGYLVNPLPLRADTAGDPTAGELLDRVRRTALAALAHQDFPFAWVAERLRPGRDTGRSPIFQTMLTLERAPAEDLAGIEAFALGEPGTRLAMGGLELESVALDPPGAPLDLTLLAAELGGDLVALLRFSTDLFDRQTAERLLAHFGNLLQGLGEEPGRRLSELPLLGPAERAQLAAWSATAVPWNLERTLDELLAERAEEAPEMVAVEAEEGALTYRELFDRARRVAVALHRLGVGREALVGICARRSPEMVIGLLGILLAGGAYVPFDPDDPRERLALLLEDSGVRVLLAERRLRASLPASGAGVLWLEDAVAGPRSAVLAAGAALPDSLAYMIYTSGSTGRPKGAMNTHRGIVNRLLWMQETFALTPADRVLQKTPTSFDVSVWELFWPLLAGARLVLARPGGHQDPAYLVERIAAAGVTTLHFVPSMLQAFLDEPGLVACRSLRRVIASGEALQSELAQRFAARLGAQGVELHNLYGPTEAAIDVTWWPVAGATVARSVPIGRPIANTRIHLLDTHGNEVPVGVTGELCIAGPQLARGYHGGPDLTAERFRPDALGEAPGARLYRTGDLARRLADGAVLFLGRLDHQVKLRGVRLELGEVEAALLAFPGVREAAAGLRGSGAEARLVAWIAPTPGEPLAVPALREALRRRLPGSAVPSSYAVLPALPRTPSGKIDRRALPDPAGGLQESGSPYAAPRTPEERKLAAIWRDLLGVDPVGVDDHFFDLGGHSLLATQMMARVRDAFGVNVPLAALFETEPTVAGLAQTIARFQIGQADEDDLASALLELENLSEDEIRALLTQDP